MRLKTHRVAMRWAACVGMIVLVLAGSVTQKIAVTHASDAYAGRAALPSHASSTVTVGLSSDLQYLDPQKTILDTCFDVWSSLFDPLLARESNEKIGAGIATKWKHVNKTTWLFTIRKGMTFTDGEKVDANAVVWNVKRITKPGFQDYAFMAPVKNAVKVNNYQVKIITKQPYAMLPALMTIFFILPPKYTTRVGEAGVNTKPVGSGPYKLSRFVRGSEVDVTVNPKWWGWKHAKPRFSKIVWRIQTDPSTRIAALKTKQVDLVRDIPSDQFSVVKADPSLQAIAHPSLRTVYLRFFPGAPDGSGKPFKSVLVRRAVNEAINIPSIIKNLLGGQAQRAATLMTPAFSFYDPSVKPYSYNLSDAKSLMAKAGYKDGFSVPFQVWSDGPSPNTVEVVQAVAADLAKIGIKADIKTYTSSTLLEMQTKRQISGFGLWSWGAALLDPDDKFWGVFNPASSATFLTNSKVAKLTNLGQSTFSNKARKTIYMQLQKLIHNNALIAPLFVMDATYGATKALKFHPRPDGRIIFWNYSA